MQIELTGKEAHCLRSMIRLVIACTIPEEKRLVDHYGQEILHKIYQKLTPA